ncbi:hypothetical protein [Austwickia sp. TVS 96-490-7B]|uniref:hypothetical protein n=1 Tax=Austwickia sp. TVS 96-490-7B TaxID=2830843 RepID=UPI001C57E5CA|nr:hypothetical protein [Austwickia sp. TVS 96-490-7B]
MSWPGVLLLSVVAWGVAAPTDVQCRSGASWLEAIMAGQDGDMTMAVWSAGRGVGLTVQQMQKGASGPAQRM